MYFTFTMGSISIFLLVLALLSWVKNPKFIAPNDIMVVIVVATLIDNLALYL